MLRLSRFPAQRLVRRPVLLLTRRSAVHRLQFFYQQTTTWIFRYNTPFGIERILTTFRYRHLPFSDNRLLRMWRTRVPERRLFWPPFRFPNVAEDLRHSRCIRLSQHSTPDEFCVNLITKSQEVNVCTFWICWHRSFGVLLPRGLEQ